MQFNLQYTYAHSIADSLHQDGFEERHPFKLVGYGKYRIKLYNEVPDDYLLWTISKITPNKLEYLHAVYELYLRYPTGYAHKV